MTTPRTNEDWLHDLRSDARRADALEDLRARLERGLFHYLRHDRSDLNDRDAAELQQMAQDFVQEALLRVLDSLDTFRGESQFTTWASKITSRVAISELRRARYKDYSLEHISAEGESLPASAQLSMSSAPPSPERFTEQESVARVLQDALDNVLTERQRTALYAYAIDGVPIEEIAHRMNTNRNALYKLVHDARIKLRSHLEAQGLGTAYITDLFADR